MGKQIVCKPRKRELDSEVRHGNRLWKKTLPFNVNPRGVLIHRVRLGLSILYHGEHSHDCVHYWCTNQSNGEGVSLTDDPPEGRLLCEICERNAVAAGEPSADELCGRHVHVGVMKAHRTCCRDDKN